MLFRSNHISAFWDFLPTVCELIGVDAPDESDGISYLPALLNKSQEEHRFLYWEYFHYNYNWNPSSGLSRNHLDSQAVRLGDWKGVRYNMKNDLTTPVELFNLSVDTAESNDVSSQHPEIVKEILNIMQVEHNDKEFFKIQ